MDASRVKIVTFAPKENANEIREVLAEAGAGQSATYQSNYSKTSFSVDGVGRFLPNENANPHIGAAGIFEEVAEERIEVVCDRSIAKQVVDALIEAHPYEEVAYDVYPLLDYSDL